MVAINTKSDAKYSMAPISTKSDAKYQMAAISIKSAFWANFPGF